MICRQLKQCIKEAKYVDVVQKKHGKKYVKGKGTPLQLNKYYVHRVKRKNARKGVLVI